MELKIENLTKHYGELCALDQFTATLKPGIYGILGPNGAGKSTLMNLLTDTLKRESGTITLDEKDILSMGRGYRAVLGYMPQQQGYYDEFTVGRFLHYMAARKGMNKKQAQASIDRLLGVVGLQNTVHKKMSTLSGGMRQRILLVQALLNDPKILLLDEPTAGLDPEERIRIRNYIAEIAADKIVLLATHVVSDVESIADQVLILRKGKLLVMDTPETLIERTRPHVVEIRCKPEELAEYQKQYIVSAMSHHNGEFILKVIHSSPVDDGSNDLQISLDEVYLYYMN